MLRPKVEGFALFSGVGIAIVNRRDAAHLAGLMVRGRLDNMRRNAKPEANALCGEFSSADTLLDPAGTAELLRRHNLMP